jgi:hypothetical protein
MEKQYKNFRTLLLSKVQQARKVGNKEIEIYTEELLRDYDIYHPTQQPLEIEIISGWKGVGDLTIYKDVTNDFVCVEHIKDKTSGNIEERRIEIPAENVNRMLKIIQNIKVGDKISCYQISKELGWDSWKDLWRERKVYFKTYYFVMKILEKLKIIEYGARSSKRLI